MTLKSQLGDLMPALRPNDSMYLSLPRPLPLQPYRCWLRRQGLAKAAETSAARKTKQQQQQKIVLLFCLFGGHFTPILEDSAEGVRASQRPYPPALVPSSDIPQAGVRAKMRLVALKLLNCGRNALKIMAITSFAGWVLLRAFSSTARPPPSLSMRLEVGQAVPGAPGVKGIPLWGMGDKERCG